MLWAGRLFEERYTPLRIFLLTLSGVGYLLLAPDERGPMTTLDLWFAVIAIAFGLAYLWPPLFAVVGLSIMFAAEFWVDLTNWTVPTVAAIWSLMELCMRGSRRHVYIGLAVASIATILHDFPSSVQEPLTEAFRIAINIGMPFLLGAYFRAQKELSQRIAEQASQQIRQVRAEERTSIAREIHDLVAHHVASIVLRVGVARNVLPLTDPRVQQVLDDVHATGTGALADLRKLVTLLREPGVIPQTSFVDPEGLEIALHSAVERSRQIGLTVTAEIDPQVSRLDARTALALLRLVQEGLANVAKHAGSVARAQLTIRLTGTAAELELLDFGGTPSTMATPGTAGHGLIGLRERIEVLGGTLQAGIPQADVRDSAAGAETRQVAMSDAGWRLSATLPLGAPS